MSPLYRTPGGLGAVSVAERNKEMNQSHASAWTPDRRDYIRPFIKICHFKQIISHYTHY